MAKAKLSLSFSIFLSSTYPRGNKKLFGDKNDDYSTIQPGFLAIANTYIHTAYTRPRAFCFLLFLKWSQFYERSADKREGKREGGREGRSGGRERNMELRSCISTGQRTCYRVRDNCLEDSRWQVSLLRPHKGSNNSEQRAIKRAENTMFPPRVLLRVVSRPINV